MEKKTQIPQFLEDAVVVSAGFENFKDEFLFAFVFKPIERPQFNKFLNVHYNAYNIIYKNIYSVTKYSIIAIKEDPIEFKIYGMQLK
jgi:hypothetical protein